MIGLQKFPRLPQLTLALIVLSIVITFVTDFGKSENSAMFMISRIASPSVYLYEVSQGDVWRLLTPIFIHLSYIHIIFNMMWLWDLGGTIETLEGRLNIFSQVVVYGIVGNLAQYTFSGPLFGGMSGVVYGLLAYVWVQGKFNPRFGASLPKEIVYMMLIWYFICWTGLLGPIANMAHTGGLVTGLIFGFVHVKIVANKL
ncbi:Rhomboid protease GlpG [hydrothermal vent metagenome]|uniref:Rhomboid protease GlpG n=1 Tax=hydrothermal vent metagenome TaxID=652676 RepID=A0A3B0ZPJ6_9ZZZZ